VASEVDICNLALSHFGQDASIDAIDPPDGSVEAEHCSIFYPIARDQQLELMPWTFATQRAALTEVTNDRDDWGYRYVLPTGCIKPRIVLPDGYTSTEDDGVPFEREGDSIYANESGATLVYTFRQTDPTKFNPGFVTALSWLLASYVLGPDPEGPDRTDPGLAVPALGAARAAEGGGQQHRDDAHPRGVHADRAARAPLRWRVKRSGFSGRSPAARSPRRCSAGSTSTRCRPAWRRSRTSSCCRTGPCRSGPATSTSSRPATARSARA
jgi:hypothetical protein